MKEIFKVGEFSQLFNVDVQTLRYYDSIGLLVPAHRDNNTGYRYYRFDQVYQLASIRYLRRLGYSLHQIREHLDSRDITHTLSKLRAQSVALREQWEQLIRIDSVIQRKISFVEAEVASLDPAVVRIRSFPDRYYLDIGREEVLYASDTFYFHPTVVFYHGKEKRFGAYLYDIDGESSEMGLASQLQVSVIPAGRFFCGYHTGPYATIDTSFVRIRELGASLPLADYQIDFNIIDQFVECDNAKYITEVQIPILD